MTKYIKKGTSIYVFSFTLRNQRYTLSDCTLSVTTKNHIHNGTAPCIYSNWLTIPILEKTVREIVLNNGILLSLEEFVPMIYLDSENPLNITGWLALVNKNSVKIA